MSTSRAGRGTDPGRESRAHATTTPTTPHHHHADDRRDARGPLGDARQRERSDAPFVEEYFTAENIDCLESDPIVARAYRVTRFFNAEVRQIRQNAEWGGWRFAGRE